MRLNLIIVAILLLVFSGLAIAQDKAEAKAEAKAETKAVGHEFVGDAKCKTCHKDVHASWMETKHAKAFNVLSDEEKKNEKCVACHITGTSDKGVLLEGVQCEACHGAGSDYKDMKIMNKKKWAADPEAQKKLAMDAGLVYPNEAVCTKCHTKEGNPNFKPFDFAKRKHEVHVFPSAAPAEEKKGE